jgi:ectoine hydroxylase-related dioxygenase (phytanoyl-CoA dioxygenase family)
MKGEQQMTLSLQHLSAHNTSLKAVLEALNKDGAVVLDNVLSSAELGELQEDSDYHLAKTSNCEGVFFGYETKRVASMIAKSKVAVPMALNPLVLGVMDKFLLPSCDQYQLNLSQLIAIGPKERRQIVHADDPMFPFDHSEDKQVMINVMWAVDDFTVENGATHIAPGSHLWPRERNPDESEMLQAEMKAGSCLIYLGSTRHAGGENRTNAYRRGLVMSYNLGWLRQSENLYLAIPRELVKSYPKRLQELVGYFVHKPNLNMIDGRDPMEYLNDEDVVAKGFKDYMPTHVENLLQRYYNGENIAVAKV